MFSLLCRCHPHIVNWHHSSSYALLSLNSRARNDVMLPIIWINHRWPYAATEEWARPWSGVPVLLSHNVWLLFLHPTRPNQTFTCAHTHVQLSEADYHYAQQPPHLNNQCETLLPILPDLSVYFSVNKVNTEWRCSLPQRWHLRNDG